MTLVATVVGACGGGGAPARTPDPLAQVRALMRDRAAMLVRADTDGFLASVAPGARAGEELVARGAAAVRLSYAAASVRPEGPRTAVSVGNAVVELVYRHAGLPEGNLFRFERSYDLVHRGGGWTITTAVAVGPMPMWTTGPVEVRRSDHFVVLHRPGLAGADAALAVAEDARRGLEARLQAAEPDPVHLLLLAGDEEEYAAFKGGPTSPAELAVAVFLVHPLSGPENRYMVVKAHRLLDPSARGQLDDGTQASATEVVRHELAHLALSRFEGPYTPGWVVEGTAMYLSGFDEVPRWREGMADGAFDGVSIDAVANDADLSSGAEYAYADAAVQWLVERFGAARFFAFYRRYLPLGVTPEFDADPTGVLLREDFDLTTTELDRRARERIERAARVG